VVVSRRCTLARESGFDSLWDSFVAAGQDFCSTVAEVALRYTGGEGKDKGLDTGYCAACMSQTRDQQRFTTSKVATD